MKKINILQFICPVGFYGAERWILALANNLDPERIQCDLVITSEDQSLNFEILNQYPPSIGSPHRIEMSSRFDIHAIKKLCHLIKERNIDIIHTHGYKSDIFGLIAAKLTGIKCISTPHGFGEKINLKLKAFIKLGCYSFRFFDKIVPLSDQLFKEVSSMGVLKSKLSYIKNGVDLSEIDAYIISSNNVAVQNKSGTHIGYVGQMIPRKGIKNLLKIFDGLWQENNNLRLTLLGDGTERKELETYAQSLASHDGIFFLGFRTDRLEIMSTFDLFAMTSSSEGIPRCLMEAMAMQLPIAAYDIPGIDVLITHDTTGLLAKLGDQDTLSQHWEKLLYNKEYATVLAKNARAYVQKEFSAARMAQEYTTLFHSVLGNNSFANPV